METLSDECFFADSPGMLVIPTGKVKEFIKKESELLRKLYKKEIDFGKFWIERINLLGKELTE